MVEAAGLLHVVVAATGGAHAVDQVAAAALAGAQAHLDQVQRPIAVSQLPAKPGLHEAIVRMFVAS